jgi:hypothetical protein
MIRSMRPIVVTMASWLLAGVVSQAPTDFSGRWTVASAPAEATKGAPAAARGDMGSGWGSTITITQDAKQLVVESIVYTRYDLQPQPRFVYALDGSETRNTVMMGRGLQLQSSRARWDGKNLSIVTVHGYADPVSGKPLTTEVTQTLTIESPTTLIVETARSGALGGRPSTTKTVYTKGG